MDALASRSATHMNSVLPGHPAPRHQPAEQHAHDERSAADPRQDALELIEQRVVEKIVRAMQARDQPVAVLLDQRRGPAGGERERAAIRERELLLRAAKRERGISAV